MNKYLKRCALSFPVDYRDLEQLDTLAKAAGLGRAGMARQVLRAGLDVALQGSTTTAEVGIAGKVVGHV